VRSFVLAICHSLTCPSVFSVFALRLQILPIFGIYA
jgi:hypothetical protein